MTNKFNRIPDVLINIAIIFVALLIGIVVVKQYLIPQPNPKSEIPQADLRVPIGSKISIDGVDWSQNKKTLLIAISQKCRFCEESLGFYHQLTQEKSKHPNLGIIAVLPQDVNNGSDYLKRHNINVDKVIQTPLDLIQVKGTPTLIMVDDSGSVINSWVGKLPPTKESEVISSFQ